MAYVLDPEERIDDEIRRVAAQRLDDAIERLDNLLDDPIADPAMVDLEGAVHEVRKRCKETRGLARLVRPALGHEFRSFDRTVRDGANQLSRLRDAHAVLGTFDALLVLEPDDERLRAMRDRHAGIATATATSGEAALHDLVLITRSLLADARHTAHRWEFPDSFDTIEAGLAATYRQGRSWLQRASSDPSDHRLHEWRKTVKYLWYQTRLVHGAAPSVLGPLVEQLDLLAEALGDDHDLAVLVELLDREREQYGTRRDIAHVTKLARRCQDELRTRAFRTGAVVYAEPEHAFVHRVERYWQLAVDEGPELETGGLDLLARIVDTAQTPTEEPRPTVERERKFLVDSVPEHLDLSDVVTLRQGYFAADEDRSVRVRDAGAEGCTLTIKAGRGAERTELEWPIDRRDFDAAWPHTAGQRIDKLRHRIAHRDADGRHVIELDVFHGDLDGLVMAEVEFTSSEALATFRPPEWFGPEVTDDGRYTNASLALHGRPHA